MKKLLLLIFPVFLLIGCTSVEDGGARKNLSLKRQGIEAFNAFGESHNMLLSHVETYFTEPAHEPANIDEALAYVASVQKGGIDNLPFSDYDKDLIYQNIVNNKQYYITDNVLKTVVVDTATVVENGAETVRLDSLVGQALSIDIIDDFEYELLSELVSLIKLNAKGEISSKELEKEVNDLISEWDTEYAATNFAGLDLTVGSGIQVLPYPKDIYMKDVPKGAVSGLILNISKNSLEYWNTPGNIPVQSRAIPVFVAADISGALFGAVLSGVSTHLLSGEINWRAVGLGALGGAVTSSTGITGRLTKFISKLF